MYKKQQEFNRNVVKFRTIFGKIEILLEGFGFTSIVKQRLSVICRLIGFEIVDQPLNFVEGVEKILRYSGRRIGNERLVIAVAFR